MNLTEQVNRGRIKMGPKNRRPVNFGSKPFLGLPTNRIDPRSRKSSTTSSNLNWGKSHQSLTNSTFLHSDTSGSKEEAKIILALSEGRGEARCEVGIAAINVTQPHLILCQISDTQSYDNTLRKINIFNPTQILVPMTFVESANQSRLIEKVKEQFPQVNCTAVKRNTYNKASGMDFIQELCVPSLNSVLLVVQYRYYALTAVSALLKFLQSNLYIFYASGSIKIDYQESEGYAVIDVSTADRLELVSSTKPLQASKYSTLFGVLNNCYTKIGERALRTILLQPPYETSIILERQECVTALIKNPDRLQAIQVVLQKLGNVDQLLTLPTIVIDDSEYCSNRQLNYMLFLNGLVDLIITFNEVLTDFEIPFFKNLCNTLKSQDFLSIRDIVRTLIHDNAYAAKSNTGLMQRCFAIKPGINGLLDLVRKIYSERLDEMREYVKSLGEKYDLPLTLGNNVTKGYHIVFSLNKHQKISTKKSDLPREFIQVCRLAGSFTMKTMELINYQSRIDDIVTDILKISNLMIFKTLTSFKKHMGLFFKLCEDVANIDVIQSLAEVSMRNNYVQPTFSDYTKVRDSHHPMLDMLAHEKPVPNLISSSEDYNVHIITGPNGSGKSIFIRQVMLIQIMAQIGGYVPASSAVFRPADRLFARIYLEDNMECGASSFVLEMKEIIYILSHATDNSLIIMDELARSTSLEEGAALAMTICEYLADSSAFIYLTSHFTLVTKLGDLYLNVKNWHMDTNASGDTPRSLQLDFKYTLKSGVTNLKRYAFFMVKNIWPNDILEDIYKIYDMRKRREQETKVQKISREIELKYQLESKLRKLKSKGQLSLSNINKFIQAYRKELASLKIILKNVNFGENRQYEQSIRSRGHISNNYNNLMNVIEDQVGNDIEESYPMEICGDSETSSYKQLVEFIDEDSRNLELLNPEINISYMDSQEIFNDDINEVNCSLMQDIKLHEEEQKKMIMDSQDMNSNYENIYHGIHSQDMNIYNEIPKETKKINILSNVLLNQVSYSETSKEVRDILQNARFTQELNIETSPHTSPIQENLEEFDDLNEINRSLITHMQMVKKNFTENNPESVFENTYNSSNRKSYVKLIPSPDLFISESPSEGIGNAEGNNLFNSPKEFDEFPFLKPFDKPLKKRALHLSMNESQKDIEDHGQHKFSLPLLQNQERTSTPLTQTPYLAENRFLNSNFFNEKPPTSIPRRDREIMEPEVCNIFESPVQKVKHLFPKVVIIEGPNDLSISFGEEDEPIRKLPEKNSKEAISFIHENDNQNVQNLEKFVKDEVKLLLSDSADLFDGDVDSLNITVENIDKKYHEKSDEPMMTSYKSVEFNWKNDNSSKMNERFNNISPELQSKAPEASPVRDFNPSKNTNKDYSVLKLKQTTDEINETREYVNTLRNNLENTTLEQNASNEKNSKEISSLNTQKNDNQNVQNLEKFVIDEVKLLLSDSADLFDGDVDSLNITVENIDKKCQEKSVKPINESFGFNGKNRETKFHFDRNNRNAMKSELTSSKINVRINSITPEFQDKTATDISQVRNFIIKPSKNKNKDYSGVKKNETTDEINKTTGHIKNTTLDQNAPNSHGKLFEDDPRDLQQFLDNNLTISRVDEQTNNEQDKKLNSFFKVESRSDGREKSANRTSISEASRKRNLDYNTSTTNSSSSDNKQEITTSISDASKKRNLENSDSSKPTECRDENLPLNQSNSSDSKKERNTTSLSVASKLRNLENVSSSSSKALGTQQSSGKKSCISSNNQEDELSFSKCRLKTLSFSSQADVDTESRGKNLNDSSNDEEIYNDGMNEDDQNKNKFRESEGENVSSREIFASTSNKIKLTSRKTLGYTRRINNFTSNAENKTKRRKSTFGHLRLTKQEIQDEFDRQDEILWKEDADIEACNKYLKQRLNRPSVKQLEKVEHIVTIRRTENGHLVLPPDSPKYKPRRATKRPLLETSSIFDMSIFSDQNEKKMSAFLASNETNYNLFKFDEKKYEFSSQHSSKSNVSEYVQKRPKMQFPSQSFGMQHKYLDADGDNHDNFAPNFNFSQYSQMEASQNSCVFLPNGYFKENKEDIDDICSKYLSKR